MSTNTNSVLKNALERLEDTLTSPVLRQTSYQDLQNALNTAEIIDKETAKRLLAVCIHDLNEDIKYATNASTVIGTLLVKVKNGQCCATPTLVASAVSVISLLKTIASANQFDALKGILFNTLLSYPDNTLMCVVAESTDKVIELLNAYINAGNKVVPLTFLSTLFKILPPANKKYFVKEALALWFSKVIPFLMGCIQSELQVTCCVELLEILTEVLVDIEYAENPHWKVLIECIYNPKKYPSIMKSILENRSDYWHRLWMVFIKLLKDQITKVSNSNGSPINSMLPVVETAFKMDPVNRCRAFQCWSVLIDNFSRESNEAYINKRLKLLLIPLKSSNAKVEETAISKFNTWWHLICRFHNKMEGLADMILMPFFQFCFGKRAAKSPAVAPGQFSDSLKKLSLQALVEIFGHVDCEGCVSIPKLKSRIISTKILVDYWNEWIFFYKVAVTVVLQSNSEQIIRQIACTWKSLVMTVGELPDNNIRKDLFNELLALTSLYVQDCQHNTRLADVVMNVMIKSLFEDDNKITSLLVTKETGPMFIILPMLSNSLVEEFYRGKTVDQLLSFFKPVTTFMMNDVTCCPNRITTWLLKRLPVNDYTLVLWVALVEAVCESKHDLAEATLVSIFSYPIQKLNEYSYEKSAIAAYKWFAAYNILVPKFGNVNFGKECIKIIMDQPDCSAANIFMLHASLAVVKQKFIQKIDEDCANVSQIFLSALSLIDTFSSIEKVFPALIDILILMGSKLKDSINVPFAKIFVSALKLTVKLLLQQTINDTTIIFVEKMLLSLLDILKVKEYQDFALIINDEILACSAIAKKHASKIKSSLSMLTLQLTNNKNKNNSEIKELKTSGTITNTATENDETMKKIAENLSNTKEAFNTPNVKYCKKSNKRAASIVNTVIENGEEYVVVKSNWKFNPRKLTENQKEKLKRKREDIPALYQDLSQSQDEFKLSAWKPDSQDTTTSSKSASISNNEDLTTVFNQISNTDVVPRIFENMLADSAKNNVGDKSSSNDANVKDTFNTQKQTTSTNNVKSPRMALKDRVFRNVRNLVEKSSLHQDVTTSLLIEDIDRTLNENTAKTPTNKVKSSTNMVNSAPPKIVSERPSRVIKKPKKFDDSEIISLKKRRQSQDARIDACDMNKMKEKQKSQVLPIDASEKKCFKAMSESQNLQLNAPEISLKNSQQSRTSQSDDVKNIDLKTKAQSEVHASKIRNLNENRQSQDTQLVEHEIISLTESQEQELRSDGEITDLITKQPSNVSLTVTVPKVNNIKKSRQFQDSQSVISEIVTLSNCKQLQESRPDAFKIGSFKNRRKSQDLRSDALKINSLKKRRPSRESPSVVSEIISLKDTQNVGESRSDGGDIIDSLSTKQQLQVSPSESPKISNLMKRRQSQDSQSVIPETITSTNNVRSQELQPVVSKAKETLHFKKRRKSQDSHLIDSSEFQSDSIDVLIEVKGKECDEDLGDTYKSADEEQYKQNLDILTDSQPKEQSINNILQDISHDSQSKDHGFNRVPFQDVSLDSLPKEQSSKSIPIEDTLPDLHPNTFAHNNAHSLNNIPFQDIRSDSPTMGQTSVLIQENIVEKITDKIHNKDKTETPTLKANDKDHEEKSAKKKESRIVKQLLIDMVEGHPLLQAQPNSEGSTPKRATRKSLLQTTNNINNRRQALSEKLEKFKTDLQIVPLSKSATKVTKKLKDKASLSPKETVTTISESQQLEERSSFSSDDQPFSEDVIESSQDSTINTISMKSSKSILKKQPVVILDKANILKTSNTDKRIQDKFNDEIVTLSDTLTSDQENKEDSQFPENITIEKPELDLTENMDTQPVEEEESYGDVIFVTDEQQAIVINTENTLRELNTQDIAEADTEPMDVIVEMAKNHKTQNSKNNSETNFVSSENTQDDTTRTISESFQILDPVDQNYSPSKDEPERKQDFLNNTQEISPIKTLSPLREKTSPSPENNEYVVIKLTSPVHSNGEPYDKCDSPEIFTEDKVSPDKRNESPPRVDVIVNNISPSSSLSLKKNRPQRRAGGRAAQMLDLCAIMNNDSAIDSTDNKRITTVHTPAKRNLKSLYNLSSARENTNIEPKLTEKEQFLEFKKSLPTSSSSPAGPILKRKFTEMSDDPTSSPANKRKRVSFHDPPVSTTVAVQKYIEPGAIRSPQQSTIKRRDRSIRNHTEMKSPKRLETVFKLENVLSKAVESFTEDNVIAAMEDTEISSMEQTPTPALEVVKSSDLNDTDPICPSLLHCNDPIENIAAMLSSPAMKTLFIKEIEGKVVTIADLAKMTELEINRLCIKAPKVQVARKVLLEYAFTKINTKPNNQEDKSLTTQKRVEIVHVDVEIQTSKPESSEGGMQTDATPVAFVQTQTDCTKVAHTVAQTDESGYTSTKDVIASCLSERPDFIAQLSKCLEVSSVHMIADNTLSFNAVLELLSKKMTITNSVEVMNNVLDVHSKSNLLCNSTQNKLSFVQNYLYNHFDSKDLILFCSQLLQKIYENSK